MPRPDLSSLPTPSLLLDRARMDRNIARLKHRLQELRVGLRPHLKTAKSIDVARRMMASPAGPATVSTLQEAEAFAAAGVKDLLYAVGIAPAKLDRVLALQRRGIDLTIVLDSVEQARAVAQKSRAHCTRVISVLATVIGEQPAKRQLIVDAGWMAVSRDRGTAGQPVDQGYGLVCDLAGQPYPDLIMTQASQEHGVLEMRASSRAALPSLPIGSLVRILPNHACATAAQHSEYVVLDETAQTRWPRIAAGW